MKGDSAIMIVLKIIGFVILGIIALIILALCVKVKIFAEYSEVDTHINLKWLFLTIPIFPMKKTSAENKSDTSQAVDDTSVDTNISEESVSSSIAENIASDDGVDVNDTDNTTTETDAPAASSKNSAGKDFLKLFYNSHGIDGILLLVQRLFNCIGTFMGKLMHSLVIEELYIDVMCNKGDAASTAIYYGEVCSALFPMLGALISKYKVRKYDINVYPDFLARHSSASFAVSMHLYPIYLIGITLSFGIKLIFKVLLNSIIKLIKYSKNIKNTKNTADKTNSVKNTQKVR